MELPFVVDRRDFLSGFTATGVVTTTKVAMAAADADRLVAAGIKIVPTMVDLRTTSPPLSGAVVWLAGYYSPLDGGEGFFHWDASSIETDNGGTNIVPAAVSTGCWKRSQDGKAIDVRWFGARGDGSTDDGSAIQSSIAALGTEGGEVFFPNGLYVLNTALTITKRNVALVGTGPRNIQNYLYPYEGGVDVPSTVAVAADRDFILFDSNFECNGFRCRDLTIIGPRSGNKARYTFNFDKKGSKNFRRDFLFERVSIQRFETAFYFQDTVGGGDIAWGIVRITRSSIMHNERILDFSDNVQINGFTFTDNEAGQNGYTSGGGINIRAHNATIVGNIFEGQRNALKIRGAYRGIVVKGNYFEANTGSYLVNLSNARFVDFGPNANLGLHVKLDQTYVLSSCIAANSICEFIHPVFSFLTPDQVINNTNTGLLQGSLLAGSKRKYAFITHPDKRFSTVPQDASSSHAAVSSSLGGSCPDPFSSGKHVRGYSQSTGAMKAFTWTNSELTFSADDWIVISFLMQRGEPTNDNPYISFRVNDSDDPDNGSWKGPWASTYDRRIDNKKVWLYTVATKSNVDSRVGNTLVLHVHPYGVDNDRKSWPWHVSVMSAYVVDNPNKIVPWVDGVELRSATSAPGGGPWSLGDMIMNKTPYGGGTVGWVCTDAGSPGVWKAFGNIET